jgi:hypothetical protein
MAKSIRRLSGALMLASWHCQEWQWQLVSRCACSALALQSIAALCSYLGATHVVPILAATTYTFQVSSMSSCPCPMFTSELPLVYLHTCSQYNSYLRTMPHADYPSGTACICAAWATFTERYLGVVGNPIGSLPFFAKFPQVRRSSSTGTVSLCSWPHIYILTWAIISTRKVAELNVRSVRAQVVV